MQSDTVEILLWSVAGVVAGSMLLILTLGWFKGVLWEQQLKRRDN
jgi:hypothetical protein